MEGAKESILCFQCVYNIIYSKLSFCNTQHCGIYKRTIVDHTPTFFTYGLYDIGHYFSTRAAILGLTFNTTNQTFHKITSTLHYYKDQFRCIKCLHYWYLVLSIIYRQMPWAEENKGKYNNNTKKSLCETNNQCIFIFETCIEKTYQKCSVILIIESVVIQRHTR